MRFILVDQNTRIKIESNSILIIHGNTYAAGVVGFFNLMISFLGIVFSIIMEEYLIIFFILFSIGNGIYLIFVFRLVELDGKDHKIKKHLMVANKVIKQYYQGLLPGKRLLIKEIYEGDEWKYVLYVVNADNKEFYIINFNSEETAKNVFRIINKNSEEFEISLKRNNETQQDLNGLSTNGPEII